jgi:protein TonB
VEQPPDIKPLDVIEVPLTKQENRQRRPERPTLPVETEDEDVPADATIDFTEINLDMAHVTPPPPPEEEEEQVEFVVYDKAPEIVGGYAELAKHLVYPEIARKAGVEGKVIVNVKLSKEGKVLGTEVIKSLGNNGCDEAAIDAIKAVTWKPAYQRDRPVNVIVAVTVIFRLK